MTRRRRDLLLQIALLGGSLLVAAAAGEIYLRTARPFEDRRRFYMRSRDVFQYDARRAVYDPDLGFALRPGLSVSFRNREYRTRVATNSLGFRDDEESLRDPQVLILGDSYAFGWGVEKEETLEARLESDLHLRVLNLGVPGYATSQEYLQLVRFGRDHPLRGRIVLVQFYPNDVSGSEKTPGSMFPAVFEGPEGIEFAHPTEADFETDLARCRGAMNHGLARHLRLLDLVLRGRERLEAKLGRLREAGASKTEGTGEDSAADPGHVDGPRADVGTAGRSTAGTGTVAGPTPAGTVGSPAHPLASNPVAKIIARMRDYADSAGARILFVYVPSVRFYEGWTEYDDQALAVLLPALEETGIPLVDLRTVLRREDYYTYDDHWRPNGHRKAAEAVTARLSELGLVLP